jgi:hypothetical protein
MAIYVATAHSGVSGVFIGCSEPTASGATHIGRQPGGWHYVYGFRFAAATSSVTQTSQVPSADNIGVFFRIGASTGYTNARIAFYSIGESLDLAALDARVTTLTSAITAALP